MHSLPIRASVGKLSCSSSEKWWANYSYPLVFATSFLEAIWSWALGILLCITAGGKVSAFCPPNGVTTRPSRMWHGFSFDRQLMVTVACLDGRKTLDGKLSGRLIDGSINGTVAWSSIMASPLTLSRDEGCVKLAGHVRQKHGLWLVCRTVSFRLTKAVPLFFFFEVGRVKIKLSRSSAFWFDRSWPDDVNCYPLPLAL